MSDQKTRIKITKRSVDALPASDREYFAWDQSITGFAVRVEPARPKHPKGRRAYIYNYRTLDGDPRRYKIGDVGTLTPDQAREIARELAYKVARGEDPSQDRKNKRNAIKMQDFESLYFDKYANARKRPRSIESDRALFRLHIQPRLGTKAMESITSKDIQDLHHAMKKTPGAANRTAALLSKVFNLAEKWGYRPEHTNPCIHLEKYPERKIENYLKEADFTRLGKVLDEMERTQETLPSIPAAIRLLTFTGARLGEILNLQWDQIDFDASCIRLRATNTKEKRDKTIHLPPAALAVLESLERREGSPWVLEGREPGKPLVNLRKPWHRIRKKAELPEGTRLHDLRHSFASMGLARGMSLPMIGKLLGHSQPVTTARYAHLAHDPAKEAADQIGNTIDAAFSAKPSAEIIELKKA